MPPHFCLMYKFNIMGKMKWLSQMIEDGTFDAEFVPAYEKAQNQDKAFFNYAGSTYSLRGARAMISTALTAKRENSIASLKKLER